MTEFSIPNIFTAGTKAKAYEVNENFAAVKSVINNNVSSIAQTAQEVSSLEDYVNNEFRYEMENLVDSVSKTSFCVNSGFKPLLAVNASDSALLDFNVDDGTNYKPLVITPASGVSCTLTSLTSLDMAGKANGKYNIFVGAEGEKEAYISNIHIKNTQPQDNGSITLPVFTANTTGGITVSDARSNSDAYTLINGVTYKAIGAWSTYWFKINYAQDTVLKQYSIKADSSGAAEYPSAWILYGSNNGTDWTSLDTRTGLTFTLGEEKTFTLSITASYKQYRISFSDGVTSSGNGELGKLGFKVVIPLKSNDIWLDISGEPLQSFKYSGSAWETSDLVPVGSATVSNGAITSVETFDFNQNGYNLNIYSPVLNVIPDYTKGVSLSVGGTTNTIEKNGWIVMNVGSASSTAAYAYINDIQVGRTLNAPGSYEARFSITAMVSKDDKVRISTTNGYITFYPMKGVN